MAKPTIVTFPTPEFKLPKFDLDALFASQAANLATVREAQMVLTGAAQAITEVQYGYIDQALAETKAVFASQELPKAETVHLPASESLVPRPGCRRSSRPCRRRARARRLGLRLGRHCHADGCGAARPLHDQGHEVVRSSTAHRRTQMLQGRARVQRRFAMFSFDRPLRPMRHDESVEGICALGLALGTAAGSCRRRWGRRRRERLQPPVGRGLRAAGVLDPAGHEPAVGAQDMDVRQ